jgi:predicted nucleotidyltransferase
LCVKRDILSTLAYFDLFQYPLTQTEVYMFLQRPCSAEEFGQAMQSLAAGNWVYKFDEFYSLQNDYSLITRRRKGNVRARQMLETSEKIAAFLSRFPFVRGVAVSGSLSKNFADEGSDIDLFIITAPNRLWLARTFMHLFKKLTYLFNNQHLFCMNYYIDEEMLQIREKNVYTATEVVTLLPLRGITAFESFYQNNSWSREYLPNHSMKVSYVKEINRAFPKRAVELLFHHPLGDLLDKLLQKVTSRRWNHKTRNNRLNNRGILMGMDAGRHHSKPDPRNFQHKLLDLYDKKLQHVLGKFDAQLKAVF